MWLYSTQNERVIDIATDRIPVSYNDMHTIEYFHFYNDVRFHFFSFPLSEPARQHIEARSNPRK